MRAWLPWRDRISPSPTTVNFPFDKLKVEFARARALVFPGEEDFGIVPIEVMACGRPVVAFKRGGALDYVIPGRTGEFFETPTVKSLNSALDRLEGHSTLSSSQDTIRAHAKGFHSSVFRERVLASVNATLARKNRSM